MPLPPILVKIFDAKEPDQKVQTEMDNLEKERSDYEKKMFTKVCNEYENGQEKVETTTNVLLKVYGHA